MLLVHNTTYKRQNIIISRKQHIAFMPLQPVAAMWPPLYQL